MLNSLYARKRKELAEAKRLEGAKPVKDAVEDRSVDDLLSFIEGGGVKCYAPAITSTHMHIP